MTVDKDKQRVAIGRRQTLKALEQQRVVKVYVAADAEQHVVGDIMEYCTKNGIQVTHVETRKLLGKTYGIDVGASVVAIVEDGQ